MRISATILVGILAVACGSGDDTNVPVTGTPVTPPPLPASATPTFTDVFTRVLTPRCQSCHMTPGGIGITLGKLDLTGQANAHAALVGVTATGSSCAGRGTRVVAGDAQASILFLKVSLVDATPCGDKMPLTGAPLTQDEVDIISGWINAGAKND